MSEPFFSPSSRRDLLEILDYIAKDKPGAAIRYVERLEEECRLLARNPQSGTRSDDLISGLRCWSVGSYMIFFRPVNDGVEIVRIVHGARDVGKLFQ